jgi:prefoldin subunit 5
MFANLGVEIAIFKLEGAKYSDRERGQKVLFFNFGGSLLQLKMQLMASEGVILKLGANYKIYRVKNAILSIYNNNIIS